MSSRARNVLRCLLLPPVCSLLLPPAPALAQGWVEIDRPTAGTVTRTASDVQVRLDGQVARVEVQEQFRNVGGGLAEGSYLYPLPGEAVFQNFSLWIGEQEIKGETLNADQARRVYEEIVRRRKDPALLTLAGHGLVRAQVFPIQPGETRKVALRYTQLLTRAGDALRFRQRDAGVPSSDRPGGRLRRAVLSHPPHREPTEPGPPGDHDRPRRIGRRRAAAPMLDRLALQGRGSVEYVAPEASVEAAMGTIATKIRHPALVNLRIESSPAQLTDLAPGQLPDLFFGEELVVLGRYHGSGSGDLVVTGERNGRRARFATRADFPSREDDNDYIPRLWAARRVGDLTRQIRLEGATPDLVSRIRDLGLRYGILTEYTSYLVQEPDAVMAGQPTRALREDMAQVTGAAGADRQTGRRAFDAAQASAKPAQTNNLEGAVEAAAAPPGVEKAAGPGPATRTLAGRVFIRRGAVWTDAGHRDTVKVTVVTSFSDAYFSLVRALPELAPWLRAGDEVLVAGSRASIRIGPSGVREWGAGQLEQLVRDFRGA